MEPAFYVPKGKRPPSEGPTLWDAVYDEADSANTTVTKAVDNRVEEVHESNASKHRADIERGKPIAVAVANRDGKVIAETFRNEAARRGVRFDSDTGDQRGLCWISTMMGQLCREGQLQKRRRSDDSVVTEYSKEQHNDQVVYEPKSKSVPEYAERVA